MSTCRSYTFIALEILFHVALLHPAFFISGLIHSSDSIMTQVPAQTNLGNNVTEVGFGIKKFSIGDNENIEFSDEQKDALGDSWAASHTSFHILNACMIVCVVIPFIIAIKRRFCCGMETKLVISKLMKNFAIYSIPFIIILTILTAVPFVLLTRSNLCGPNYIELRFEEEPDDASEDASGDSAYRHEDCIDLQGTIAIVHEDVSSSCSVGQSGIAAAVLLAIWPFFMVGHALFLNWRGDKLESDSRNAAAADATVIEVYEVGEKQDTEEDTVIVQEGAEKDVEKAQIY